MIAKVKGLFAILMILIMAMSFASCKDADDGKADSVWLNGTIYTVDDEFSVASAIAVVGDKLVYVGDDEGVQDYIGKNTTVTDLDGKCVLPGLIDSHLHMAKIGSQLSAVDIFWAPKEVILEKVKEAAEAAQPGEWIQGRGWIESVWPDKKFPTKEDLDAIAPDNPVYLTRADGHTIWVNSKALEIGGITNKTPNPQGGYIYRDAAGEATGILTDTATNLISQHLPASTLEDGKLWLEAASGHLSSYGITSAMDAGTSPAYIPLYEELIKEDKFHVRTDAEISINTIEDDGYQYIKNHEPRLGDLNNMLDVMAVKVVSDGAMGGRSAAMIEEYNDAHGKFGELIFTDDEFYQIAKAVYDNGYQLSIHAIGDAASRQVLNTFEKLQNEGSREDIRTRIEHYQCVQPEDMDKTVKLNVLPCFNAIHATSDMLVAEDRWGTDRMAYSYAWRTMLDKGAIIPNGSDAPVELANPYHGFYASVTRMSRGEQPPEGWYADQCMTREEALRSFTIWGAYSMFGEEIKGSLEEGKLADFVVIDRDYMTCEAWELMNIQALTTVLGGKVVYEKNTSIPTVSWQGVPVTYYHEPYMDNGEVFAPLEDMVNALSAKSESMDNMQYKVTLNKKSAKLMAAEKDGIAYVNVKEFYEGLGFKTQWQAESATISVGA